jgi:arsenate reductase (thioredoxin)
MKTEKLAITLLIIALSTSVFCQTSKPIILFVCEHGAARSVIASAYFNKLAKEKNLNYKAIFRGTNPDTLLTAGTTKGLTKDGFDTKKWKPTSVTQSDLNASTQVITFDCALPNSLQLNKPVSKWDSIPAISKDYDAARNKILERVKILIEELANKKK